MIPLETQDQFESLLNQANKNPQKVVVYFTASWCGACTRLNHSEIQASNSNIVWYKCDIDQNKYTLGYCGLKQIPSFAIIKDSKFLGKFTSSDTATVIETLNDAFN
jgi:thioredoxin-like negative regulator of GroEL